MYQTFYMKYKIFETGIFHREKFDDKKSDCFSARQSYNHYMFINAFTDL